MPDGQGNIADRMTTADRIMNLDPYKKMGEDSVQGGLAGLSYFVNDWLTGAPSQERQFLYDMAMMDEQNQWNLEQWNRENEYNSTKAQLERWKEAGGNPNAFFSGGTNVGNASSVTSGSPGNVDSTIGVGNEALKTIMQGAKDATDTALRADKQYWENEKLKEETEKTREEKKQVQIENGSLDERNQMTIKMAQKQIDLWEKQGKLTHWQTRQIQQLLPALKCKTEAECQKTWQEYNLLQEQTKESKHRQKLMTAQTRKEFNEALKLEWENFYRRNFYIDPGANWQNNIVTASLSGHADRIIQPLLNLFQQVMGDEDQNIYSVAYKWIFEPVDKWVDSWFEE